MPDYDEKYPSLPEDYNDETFIRILDSKIGAGLLSEFRQCYPLLTLTSYRYFSYTETYAMQKRRMSDYDGPPYDNLEKKGIWRKLKDMILLCLRAPVYTIIRIRATIKRWVQSAPTGLSLFSNTFLESSRYIDVRKEILKTDRIARMQAFDEMPIPFLSGIKKGYWNHVIRSDLAGVDTLFFGRESVIGRPLKKALYEWFDFFWSLMENDNNATNHYDETRRLLRNLEKAYTVRVDKLSRFLKKKGISSFVTINQYNPRDVITIASAQKAGIPTKQFEHHPALLWALPPGKSQVARLSYANEYGVWSDSDAEFHKKVCKYIPTIYANAPRIYSVGNPEITFDKAIALNTKIRARRQITYMVADEGPVYRKQGLWEEYCAWRRLILHKLSELGEKKKVSVRIRYKPNMDLLLRAQERALTEQLGFFVSEGTQESLMDDFFTSIAIFSTASSVLCTAELLGRAVYRIEDLNPTVKYAQTSPNIHGVCVEDIPAISLPEGTFTRPLDRNDFFDQGKLFSQ